VRITAGTLSLDGRSWRMHADPAGRRQRGGVLLNVGTLSGAGVIRADGGPSSSNGGSGSGGRVAIYYDALNGFDLANDVTAHGGAGSVPCGGHGVPERQRGEGVLRVDSHGRSPACGPVGMASDSTLSVDRLVISGAGVVAGAETNAIEANNVEILGGAMLTTRHDDDAGVHLRMTVTGELLIDGLRRST